MLTLSQRQQLETLHAQKLSQAAIARQLGVHRSTVKRELERNSVNGVYRAEKAQQLTSARRQKAGRENQQQRTFYFYFKETLIRANVLRQITLEKNPTQKSSTVKTEARKYLYTRFRHWRIFTDPRSNRKRLRLRSRNYRAWKRCYDSTLRFRDYFKENLFYKKRIHWDILSQLLPEQRTKRRLRGAKLSRHVNETLMLLKEWEKLKEERLKANLKDQKDQKVNQPKLNSFRLPILITTATYKGNKIAVPTWFILKIFKPV
jgi:hypothetical protein